MKKVISPMYIMYNSVQKQKRMPANHDKLSQKLSRFSVENK